MNKITWNSFVCAFTNGWPDNGAHTQIASSWGQHGAHLGPVGPRWPPCWPHKPCYKGIHCNTYVTSAPIAWDQGRKMRDTTGVMGFRFLVNKLKIRITTFLWMININGLTAAVKLDRIFQYWLRSLRLFQEHSGKGPTGCPAMSPHKIPWLFPDISLTILWFSLTMRHIIDISLLP